MLEHTASLIREKEFVDYLGRYLKDKEVQTLPQEQASTKVVVRTPELDPANARNGFRHPSKLFRPPSFARHLFVSQHVAPRNIRASHDPAIT